jgi:hypothetical protein
MEISVKRFEHFSDAFSIYKGAKLFAVREITIQIGNK